jgi:hypothetical protein
LKLLKHQSILEVDGFDSIFADVRKAAAVRPACRAPFLQAPLPRGPLPPVPPNHPDPVPMRPHGPRTALRTNHHESGRRPLREEVHQEAPLRQAPLQPALLHRNRTRVSPPLQPPPGLRPPQVRPHLPQRPLSPVHGDQLRGAVLRVRRQRAVSPHSVRHQAAPVQQPLLEAAPLRPRSEPFVPHGGVPPLYCLVQEVVLRQARAALRHSLLPRRLQLWIALREADALWDASLRETVSSGGLSPALQTEVQHQEGPMWTSVRSPLSQAPLSGDALQAERRGDLSLWSPEERQTLHRPSRRIQGNRNGASERQNGGHVEGSSCGHQRHRAQAQETVSLEDVNKTLLQSSGFDWSGWQQI